MSLMETDGILPGIPLSKFYKDKADQLLIAVTEKKTKAELDAYVETAKKVIENASTDVS